MSLLLLNGETTELRTDYCVRNVSPGDSYKGNITQVIGTVQLGPEGRVEGGWDGGRDKLMDGGRREGRREGGIEDGRVSW